MTIQAPTFATNIFEGNDTAPMNASGIGNMNIRKTRGKMIILVIFVPSRKRDTPNTRKKIEKPDSEKT